MHCSHFCKWNFTSEYYSHKRNSQMTEEVYAP